MNTNKFQRFEKMIKKSPIEFAFIALTLVFMVYAIMPTLTAQAYEDVEAAVEDVQWETSVAVAKIQNETKRFGELPESERAEPRPFTTVSVSAYNSVPWQTDATPCIGAQGTDICQIYESGENVCAANFVPLGTILVVDGLGECVVRDRMNARYYYRVDWYMGMDVAAARAFGVQRKTISMYPNA